MSLRELVAARGRRIRRHARGLVRALLPDPLPQSIPQLDPSEVAHPSELCRCGDVMAHEHAPDCEWARVMCRVCDGTGHCRACGGEGTDPQEAR